MHAYAGICRGARLRVVSRLRLPRNLLDPNEFGSLSRKEFVKALQPTQTFKGSCSGEATANPKTSLLLTY